MLATLATLFIIEGVALTYTGGSSISQGMPHLDGRLAPGERGSRLPHAAVAAAFIGYSVAGIKKPKAIPQK